VSIDSVAELRSHDLLSAPDYYPTIDYSPDHWGQVGGPYLESTGTSINPDWLSLRSMTADTTTATATIRIYDADEFLTFEDDISKLNGDDEFVTVSIPIASCLQDASTCLDSVFQSNGSTPVLDLGIFGTIPTGSDSSSITYSVEVCEWSTCLPIGDTGSPTADAGGPYSVDEGDIVTLTGAASTDPNQSTDSLTFEWDFDSDGQFDDATGMNVSFAGVDGPADVTVFLRVTDDDGNQSIADSIVTVANVAPTIDTLTVDSSVIDEAQSIVLSGTFHDPALGVPTETFELEVDWNGDTIYDQTIVVSGGTFSVPHTYLDDNPTGTSSDTFDIHVRLTDDDGGEDTDQVSLTVDNVDPVIGSLASDATFDDLANEGETVTVSGTFSDVGVEDTFTAVVDWGDGSPVAPVTVTGGSGAGSLTSQHAYIAGGVYNITVTLTDDDLGIHQAETIAVVTGVGLNDGTLFVIGTNEGEDEFRVYQSGSGVVSVEGTFIPEDFRSYDPSDAEINTIIAYLGDGDDHGTISSRVTLPAIIHGGDGDDHLNAGGGLNVLDGGSGNDRLVGSSGWDILIGGTGLDRLTGSTGHDLLIGGSIDDDEDDGDDSLLLDVLAAWSDEAVSFQDRADLVAALLTVFDDEEEDLLTGGAQADAFFDGLGDVLTDFSSRRDELI